MKKVLTSCLAISFFLLSCQKDPLNDWQESSSASPLKQLENPYSLKVMQKAYLQLARTYEDSFGTGSAPMLKRTYGYYGFTTNSQVATFFLKANALTIGANVIVNLLQFVLPDITFHFNTSIESDDLYELVFHECAHASHWSRVGSTYWVKYINYIITYRAYGNGTGQNAGYCGVGEMWGNYIGALISKKRVLQLRPLQRNNDVWLLELV